MAALLTQYPRMGSAAILLAAGTYIYILAAEYNKSYCFHLYGHLFGCQYLCPLWRRQPNVFIFPECSAKMHIL